MNAQSATASTVEKILGSALLMVQQRGFSGFSFRDIAREVGIKTASIHYHFPTKPDLAQAVLAQVRAEFTSELDRIDTEIVDTNTQLESFIAIFQNTFANGDRLCPFCMVACAQDGVPDFVRAEVQSFWSTGEQWVTKKLEQGSATGTYRRDLDSATAGRTFIAMLEGAMVTARAFEDRSRLDLAGEWFLSEIMR